MICGSAPITSASVQPNIRSAAGFHSNTVRSVPNATIASAAHSITARAITSERPLIVPACSAVTRISCHAGPPAVEKNTPGRRVRPNKRAPR